MAEQKSQQDSSVAGSSQVKIAVDFNKSAEQYIKDAETQYIIPILIREKYTDLVKLIVETESMDAEEREYWLQIMPIMSEEQIIKLKDILENEKTQLKMLDQKYNDEMSRISSQHRQILDEAKLKKKLESIKEAEAEASIEEKHKEEALLKQLEDL